VVDLKYIAHDAYTIFHALMTTIHEWFGISSARLSPSFEVRRSSCLDRRVTLSNEIQLKDMLNLKLFFNSNIEFTYTKSKAFPRDRRILRKRNHKQNQLYNSCYSKR
jgi:hypothetical protein